MQKSSLDHHDDHTDNAQKEYNNNIFKNTISSLLFDDIETKGGSMSLLILFCSIASAHYPSNRHGVGLGITTGPVMNSTPEGSEISFSGGFYTNIPLIETFHITPSTTVYRYNGNSTTDISLGFTFIVPLNRYSLMGGIKSGITSDSTLVPHVGLFGGGTFSLVSNIDWFIQGIYLYQFHKTARNSVSVVTGPLFRFSR